MGKFNLFLAGFGFPDRYLGSPALSTLLVHKKGDVWRARTGEKYQENIFKYGVGVSYESGFGPAFDEIIRVLNNDKILSELVANCKHVELQVSISADDDLRIPQIHFTSKQMEFFGRIGVDLEVNIT